MDGTRGGGRDNYCSDRVPGSTSAAPKHEFLMNAQSVDTEHYGLPIFFISLTEEHQGLPMDPDNFWTFGGILCDSCPVFVNLLAEGGGIEPPTPYRVYGLAIRCITALPSLRIVCRPRRPQRRLPGRLLECGDSACQCEARFASGLLLPCALRPACNSTAALSPQVSTVRRHRGSSAGIVGEGLKPSPTFLGSVPDRSPRL